MTSTAVIDPWFLDHLVCPRDRQPLALDADSLRCGNNHRYPIVDGVPVMLLDDVRQTFKAAGSSLSRAAGDGVDERAPELYLESIEISDEEKRGVLALAATRPSIDPVVAYLVAATNGLLYRHLIGQLTSYPIPDITVPPGDGRTLLDIGCSWGRWTLAAASRGYRAVGIDPSLGAVMAARRVSAQLGIPARFVVGDARYLPFADHAFDSVYSYSVIQHFSREDAARAVEEIGRVLESGGTARVQMPTRYRNQVSLPSAAQGVSRRPRLRRAVLVAARPAPALFRANRTEPIRSRWILWYRPSTIGCTPDDAGTPAGAAGIIGDENREHPRGLADQSCRQRLRPGHQAGMST